MTRSGLVLFILGCMASYGLVMLAFAYFVVLPHWGAQ